MYRQAGAAGVGAARVVAVDGGKIVPASTFWTQMVAAFDSAVARGAASFRGIGVGTPRRSGRGKPCRAGIGLEGATRTGHVLIRDDFAAALQKEKVLTGAR